MEKWGPHHTYKTFNPKLFLPKRNAGTKMEQRLKNGPTSDWPNLGSILWAGTNLWPYYWCSVVLAGRSLACLRGSTHHPTETEMHVPTANYWMSSGTSMEELGKGFKERTEVDNCIGRPTVSNNLEPWELPEIEPPTQEHSQVGPRSPAHM